MTAIIKVSNLKKYFPARQGFLTRSPYFVRAVDGVDLEINQGETLGLVGESGCGKSTIGRLILRLIDPTEGNIWFREHNLTRLGRNVLRPFRKDLQIIFQDPYSSLNPRMHIGDIIGEGLKRSFSISKEERKKRVLDIMNKVGLRPEHYLRYPHEFSGGQRQRIGIARAMVLNPQFVVADEPLSALDVSIQAQTVNLLEKLKEEFRLSYLFISHDLSVVEHISDRIAVMYLGKIIELANRDALYDHPCHPYTVALLSAVPRAVVGPKKQRIILKGDIPSPSQVPKGCRFITRCYKASDVCSRMDPPLKKVEENHYAACHLC